MSYPTITVSSSGDTPALPPRGVEVPIMSLIQAEILAVTSSMRKNQRWASAPVQSYPFPRSSTNGLPTMGGLRGFVDGRSRQGTTQSLMSGFMQLKMDLREVEDLSQLDALTLLQPFLEVVRSPETSGPITATALTSIDKFLTYSVLHPHSPSLSAAMTQLSSAATHCKFEASDSVSDEVVLLKILDVLRNCLTGQVGECLGDESVCEMMETGLSMCCQMRLSEMLRRSAERTMQALVSTVFTKLRTLPSHDAITTHEFASTLSLSDSVSKDAPQVGVGAGLSAGVRMTAPDPRSGNIPAAREGEGGQEEMEDVGSEIVPEDVSEDGEPRPYSLPSIKELLRVLISLLNPHDQQHTDSMRSLALGLLNIAFEEAGESIGRFPSLRVMVADQLCKHLFQLARSDNLALLSSSLRVISNIFDTMRPHLKLQQELLLSFLLDRLILPLPSTVPGTRKSELEPQLDLVTWAAVIPTDEFANTTASGGGRDRGNGGEARELMFELVGHFAAGRFSLVDLWVGYDCMVEGEDVFERLIKFLCRGVFPSGPGPYLQENSQLLCLDTVLELVGHMSGRLDDQPQSGPDAPRAAQVAAAKSSKQVLLEGAAAFNLKPKVGLKFLEEHGVIYSDPAMPRPESLARFFKTTPRLDKKLLGDFISRPDQLEVLRAFMGLMEFDGKIICDAMRELLEAFRLPGESQQIARITETFAEVYFATSPPDIKSQDAAYVLAYSVIMLNTDLHNPQVRKRMDILAYSRNLRGVNDNSDFTPEYLKSIYDSIRKREIVLPEEHQNQVGFEYGWKELLRRTRQAGPYVLHTTNEFDRGMFAITWKPLVSTMSFAFANFQDDYVVQRSIAGFNQCAALAARFDMPEVFDYLILSLSRVTGLLQASPSPSPGNFSVVDLEGQKVTISPLAVKFGTNVKAQLAAVVLFTIANNNGASIREGWSHIFEIYQALFVHSLLPPSLLAMEDFLSGESVIPLKPKSAPAPREDRRNDGGLLSTLSSYLLSPYGSSDVPVNDFTDEDIETTLSTVDCIASCRLEELYAQILELQGEALLAPVEVIVTLMQKMTVDRVRSPVTVPTIAPASFPISAPIAPSPSRVQLPYNPSAVLLLEVLTSIVLKSSRSIRQLWPIAFDYLCKVLAAANSFSSLFNERVVAALLRLCLVVIQYDELRASVFVALDLLEGLSPVVLASVAEPLMEGLSKLVVENAGCIRTSNEWSSVFSLFSATIQQEEAAKLSFDLMRRLASGQLGAGLRDDNYASFLQVLSGFAVVGDRASDDPAMQRGRQIVDILRDTQTAIPQLIASSTLSPSRAWEDSWIPLLSAYAALCLNPSRELRQISIGSLQRTLLSPEILTSESIDLTLIFERVFFPLLEELLKPQVFRRDPDGMGETRLRASALLCKIFLQYLVMLSERGGMMKMCELWLRILGYMDRFMHSGRRDQMYEAVPESLKNVLLVMNASRFLIPPHEERTEDQIALWDATFDRIQPFLPDLKAELFPAPKIAVPFEELKPAPSPKVSAEAEVPFEAQKETIIEEKQKLPVEQALM